MASHEKELRERAAQSSRALREQARSLPPEQPERDVREGVAASAELGILLLQKLGEVHLGQVRLESKVDHMARETRLTDLFIEERRSRLELDEEVTRADLNLRKIKVERFERIMMRIIAAALTPPATITIWDWIQKALH